MNRNYGKIEMKKEKKKSSREAESRTLENANWKGELIKLGLCDDVLGGGERERERERD